jgi:DeoR/GlpR family transcriptional regulator of sugar metabolism
VAEKLAIAREALRRVREGDSIMLDASSTVLQMAKLLPDMPLTVVTNSIRAALELASRRSIRVISTGGSLLERSLSFAGPLAERAVSEIHVQKLFVSCKGLDREGGFSESNELLARLKTRMLEVSDVSYALLDHTKLGGKSLAAFAAPKDFKEIITDAGSPAAFFAKFRKSGLKLTRV